jgi:lipopolysaccharide biosynthesis regulator YciM
LRTIKAGEDVSTLLDLFSRHAKDSFRLGRYAEAVKDYELALQIDPARVPLYTALGDLYHLQQQPRAALETWCRGLWTGYSDAVAERLVAVAKEVEDAWSVISLLRDCVARHPRDGRYRFLLAKLLRQAGEEDKSLARLEEAVRLSPHLTEAQEELGDLYARAEQVRVASATYRAGLGAARAQETVYRCAACAYVTHEDQERCFQCNRWGTLESTTRGEAEARASFPRSLLEPRKVARSLSTLWNKVAGQLPSGN